MFPIFVAGFFILLCIFICMYILTPASPIHRFHLPPVVKKLVLPKEDSKQIFIYLALCDHFQPFSGSVSQEIAEHRVVTWCKEYPRFSKMHLDSNGKNPIHTFFYSEEDYNPQFLDLLYRLYKERLIDIEVMLPYANKSIEQFKHKIEEYRDVLFHHHGYLRKDSEGKITYGYLQGHPLIENDLMKIQHSDLRIATLKETGCFADFTTFSSEHNTDDYKQPFTINSDITNAYYLANVTETSTKDNLLHIAGPHTRNWRIRKWGIFPRMENGEISAFRPFYPFRLNFWLKSGLHIDTTSHHIFIKLHTFGGLDHSIRYLIGENGLDTMWSFLEKTCLKYNFVLNYVSAWEMYSLINTLSRSNFSQNKNNTPIL